MVDTTAKNGIYSNLLQRSNQFDNLEAEAQKYIQAIDELRGKGELTIGKSRILNNSPT